MARTELRRPSVAVARSPASIVEDEERFVGEIPELSENRAERLLRRAVVACTSSSSSSESAAAGRVGVLEGVLALNLNIARGERTEPCDGREQCSRDSKGCDRFCVRPHTNCGRDITVLVRGPCHARSRRSDHP